MQKYFDTQAQFEKMCIVISPSIYRDRIDQHINCIIDYQCS